MAAPEITAQELKRRLDEGEPLLVLDVREPWECAIARLPAARNIPLQELPRRLQELPRDSQIITLCKVGGRSRRAAEFLLGSGFTSVANLSGGIDAWAREVDPTLPTY